MGTFRDGLNFADSEFWDVHVATDNYRQKCCKMIAVVLISRKILNCEQSEIKITANICPFKVLVHLSRRLKCTIVITRCPSSVRLSVCPSLTFHIFDFSSDTTEQNSTKLDRKQELNIIYRVCVFRADPKNKMAALASDWLRHFRLLLWNRWAEFNKTWQDARSQCPLPSLCFLGRSEKTTWPSWPLIGWDIFDFSSGMAERNSTNFYRKQDLNILYPVCVFRADRKNKMAALASDWMRHFRLLLWNRWTEFNKTWQEARSQRPLRSLCFFRADRKNKMADQ